MCCNDVCHLQKHILCTSKPINLDKYKEIGWGSLTDKWELRNFLTPTIDGDSDGCNIGCNAPGFWLLSHTLQAYSNGWMHLSVRHPKMAQLPQPRISYCSTEHTSFLASCWPKIPESSWDLPYHMLENQWRGRTLFTLNSLPSSPFVCSLTR